MWRHIAIDHSLSRQKVGKGAYMQSKTGVREKKTWANLVLLKQFMIFTG